MGRKSTKKHFRRGYTAGFAAAIEMPRLNIPVKGWHGIAPLMRKLAWAIRSSF